MSLNLQDLSGLHALEKPAGQLGGVPDLVALHEPTPAVDLVPLHVLQQTEPEPRPVQIRRGTGIALTTIAIHIGFAAVFVAFLTWRPAPQDHEEAIPVDVVVAPPPPRPKPAPVPEPPKPEAPKQEPSKTVAQAIPQPPPAPDPHPPAPPVVQPPPTAEAPAPPPLLAPPPDATRARTQTQDKKPANLEPDDAAQPSATHEAKPLDAPKVLSTTDAKAGFAVPRMAEVPKPKPPAPGPDAPKAPTETDKLAAALPSDMTALPESFRAVLSGNGAAIDAAYKGLVYGRFSQAAAEISERARQQNLKGQVIVAFTIDDEGGIKSLSVLQSSGNPAVDALGIEMIRSAAPFPAPPPGAPRSFTPALAFGG